MKIEIRRGTEADFAAVLEMIQELAAFEKAPDAVTNSLERMKIEKDLFGFFIAEADGRTAGMALYFFAYYTWVGKSLYLDDIYVKPEFRGLGIGSMLLNKIFETAYENDCQRLRWQVLDWNTNAIEIYRKKAAAISNEWLNCDYNRPEIVSIYEGMKSKKSGSGV